MRNLLLLFILLFSLTSCGDSEVKAAQQAQLLQEMQENKAQKEALLLELKSKEAALQKARQEAQQAQAKLLAQEQARKEAFLKQEALHKAQQVEEARNKKLSPAGIEIEKDKIIIDTNRTKTFFQQLGKTFESKISKITQDIEKGLLEEKDAGIQIDETHINIDLNKTKDFLEQWGKKMQGFVKEFDSMAQELDDSIKTIDQKQ